MTLDYIEWAQFWCPEPVAATRSCRRAAFAAYDEPDARIGDDAEGDDFLTRVLWLETAVRLARLGWTILEVEEARWPFRRASSLEDVLREIGDRAVEDSGLPCLP